MSKTCFHCGLDVPEDVDLPIHYQGHNEPACCVGCQAVAQSIIDAGLEQYYQQRTAQAHQATLPPQEILDQIKLYDLPEIQQDFVEHTTDNQSETVLMLEGMTCAACVWLIEQRLSTLPGITQVDLNYSTQRARVRWNHDQLGLSDILLKVRQTGYIAHPYDAAHHDEWRQKERKSAILRLWVAALSMMQVMMYAVPTYLFGDIEDEYLWLLHWASMVLTLPVVFYSAIPFYQGALRDFKNRRVGMDTPIALAIILAFSGSLIALIMHAPKVFFDSISMLVFLLLSGRYLEQNARRKAADATDKLTKLVPAFCHHLPNYPQQNIQQEAVARIQPNDVLLIKTGEVIPADGVIIQGHTEIDEAMLTGESLPLLKQEHDIVTAGTLNLTSPIYIQVRAVGSQTRLGSIVRLLDSTLGQKPQIVRLADRYASWFITVLLLLAIAVFTYWLNISNALNALWVTVSLLVITCPCALSLATPAALTAATGHLSSAGLLISNGKALEALAEVSDVVLDKTGTLTAGQLTVAEVLFADPLNAQQQATAIGVMLALEQHSEHPIARALCRHFDTDHALPIHNIDNHIGQGLAASFDNQTWRLGSQSFVAAIAPNLPHPTPKTSGSVVFLGNNTGLQAAFVLTDSLKEDAKSTINALHHLNLTTHLLSGDHPQAVEDIANNLGIKHRRAAASPEEKLDYVINLQKQGRKVLMIGDGVNDALVLARADVSVAMAEGADVSRAGSDMVMMNKQLSLIPRAINVGRKTRRIIRENLTWALAYNLIAVPIAATGHASPAIAALGMATSSLLVVSNALRLLR